MSIRQIDDCLMKGFICTKLLFCYILLRSMQTFWNTLNSLQSKKIFLKNKVTIWRNEHTNDFAKKKFKEIF